MENQRSEIEACLRHIPLLQPLTDKEVANLAERVRVEQHSEETTLFHQGDPGDSFYIVKEGEVEINVSLPTSTHGQDSVPPRDIRKRVDKGGSFGEMSLLTGANRAGEAKVMAASELIVIEKSVFRELLLANDSVAAELGATMLRLLADNQGDTTQSKAEKKAHPLDESPSVIIEEPVHTEASLLKQIKNFFGL